MADDRDEGRTPLTQLSYWVLPVADVARARTFFGAVLGWEFEDGPSGGAHVVGSDPMGGLAPGGPLPVVVAAFSVADLFTTLADVRARGGSAEQPDSGNTAHGTWVGCTDDQGTAFALFQPGHPASNRAAASLG